MVASSLSAQWVRQELAGMQSPAFLLSGRVRRAELPASGGQGPGEKEGLCADGTPAQVGGRHAPRLRAGMCTQRITLPMAYQGAAALGLTAEIWKPTCAGGRWNSEPARTKKLLHTTGIHLRARISHM